MEYRRGHRPGQARQGERAAAGARGVRLHPPGGPGLAARSRERPGPSRHQAGQPDAATVALADRRLGTIKLLDLGLASSKQPIFDGAMSGTLTVAGKVVGTIDFIAPEQARDASSVDIRADLYSLGCTFYFLLTGRPPFEGATVTNKLFKHAVGGAGAGREVSAGGAAGGDGHRARLMAKRPEDRYQTPAEAAAVLAAVVNGRPAPAPTAVTTEPRQPRPRRHPSRRRSWRFPSPRFQLGEDRRIVAVGCGSTSACSAACCWRWVY